MVKPNGKLINLAESAMAFVSHPESGCTFTRGTIPRRKIKSGDALVSPSIPLMGP